jgi:FkbM family methyltransferase
MIVNYCISVLRRWGFLKGITKLLRINNEEKFSVKELSENKWYEHFEHHGIVVKSAGKKHVLLRSNELSVLCRRYSSDLDVVQQLLIDKELGPLLEKIENRKIAITTIIDVGGNIGLSTLLFQLAFPNSLITTIEPDDGNFEILRRNMALNKIKASALPLGIWKTSCRLFFDRSFRDGREWAIALTTEPVSEKWVEAISINELLAKFELRHIDLLKIDIEGGERFIFESTEQGLEFLDCTKVLAIEIHDEFDIRNRIVDILKKRNYEIGESGEYLIAFNKSII